MTWLKIPKGTLDNSSNSNLHISPTPPRHSVGQTTAPSRAHFRCSRATVANIYWKLLNLSGCYLPCSECIVCSYGHMALVGEGATCLLYDSDSLTLKLIECSRAQKVSMFAAMPYLLITANFLWLELKVCSEQLRQIDRQTNRHPLLF